MQTCVKWGREKRDFSSTMFTVISFELEDKQKSRMVQHRVLQAPKFLIISHFIHFQFLNSPFSHLPYFKIYMCSSSSQLLTCYPCSWLVLTLISHLYSSGLLLEQIHGQFVYKIRDFIYFLFVCFDASNSCLCAFWDKDYTLFTSKLSPVQKI